MGWTQIKTNPYTPYACHMAAAVAMAIVGSPAWLLLVPVAGVCLAGVLEVKKTRQ